MTNKFASMLAAALVPLALCGGITELRAAPTQAQQSAIRSSCQTDYRTYCASVPTGGSAALQCLQKNVASLSASCQQAVQAVSGGATTAAPADGTAPAATTTAPAATAPATAAPAPSSKAPVIVVLKPGQEIAVMREACGADYRTHCAGVRIIGGGALSCLVSHSASLSAACKSALGELGQKF